MNHGMQTREGSNESIMQKDQPIELVSLKKKKTKNSNGYTA